VQRNIIVFYKQNMYQAVGRYANAVN